MLRAAVRCLDRVEERVVVGPSAVHGDCGLELEGLVELDCGMSGEQQAVRLVVIVFRSRKVL